MGLADINLPPIVCEFTLREKTIPSSNKCTGFKIQYKFGEYHFIWVWPGYKIRIQRLASKTSNIQSIKLG